MVIAESTGGVRSSDMTRTQYTNIAQQLVSFKLQCVQT